METQRCRNSKCASGKREIVTEGINQAFAQGSMKTTVANPGRLAEICMDLLNKLDVASNLS